jgi:hypothetical protein
VHESAKILRPENYVDVPGLCLLCVCSSVFVRNLGMSLLCAPHICLVFVRNAGSRHKLPVPVQTARSQTLRY